LPLDEQILIIEEMPSVERPREELVQIVTKIGCDSGSGVADFLDNRVFHRWGWVRSSGVQITGMCR